MSVLIGSGSSFINGQSRISRPIIVVHEARILKVISKFPGGLPSGTEKTKKATCQRLPSLLTDSRGMAENSVKIGRNGFSNLYPKA